MVCNTDLEDTLAFALNIIRVVGMAVISLYVGIGLAAAPIGHLRGYRDPRQELGDVVNRRLGVELEIAGIRQSRSVRPKTSFFISGKIH